MTEEVVEGGVRNYRFLCHIEIDYCFLLELFDKPDIITVEGADCDVVWEVVFPDNTNMIICNFQDGLNYLGDLGAPLIEIHLWQIHGDNDQVIENILNVLREREGWFTGWKYIKDVRGDIITKSTPLAPEELN